MLSTGRTKVFLEQVRETMNATSARAVAATSPVLCETKNVTHDFKLPNGNPIRVLDDISLTIQPDEVVALLGPSGCGKSTILRILAGLIQPTQGEILYHDQPLQSLNPGVAIVFQSFALYPWMTVTENIENVFKSGRVTRQKNRRAVDTCYSAGGSCRL
jgi:NitT/TauT family transport system ATP-binding protein